MQVERLTAKTGSTSCTKRTISFEVSGFHTETRLLQRDFIFLNLFELLVFRFSKCTIESHIIDFQPFLTSFVIFHAFTDFLSYMTLKMKSTTCEVWKGWNLAWYHHFTHIACAKKLRGLRKNWMHFMYKMDNLFPSIRDSYRNSSVTKGFHFFELIWTPDICVFKMHHRKPHHQFSTLSDFIFYFSCIYWFF